MRTPESFTRSLSTRINEDQEARMLAEAARTGLSVTKWVRRMLDGLPPAPIGETRPARTPRATAYW